MVSSTLVWDIGGVLLSNGWDHQERQRTAERFALDPGDLDRRVTQHAPEYEMGRCSLADFLGSTVFYTPRSFGFSEFREFIFGLSRANDPVLALARRLAARGDTQTVALNNEGAEFNRYRIDTFGLHEIFSAFFSSCYTGIRKPDAEAFRLVVGVLQVKPEDCLFIDDRAENVAAAAREGMRTIHFQSIERLESELVRMGILSQ